MQTIIRNTRNSLEARLASGMPAYAGGSVSFGSVGTGSAYGANLCSTPTDLSGMQCSGGRTSGPGDDV
jgi:hypothetical protein